MPWRWRCLVAMLRCYWSPGFFDSSSQLVCILGSGISHLPLERCSVGFRSGELAGQSSAVIIWSENHLVVVLALWAGGKGNWHLLKACQEMEAWSVVKPPGRRPHWLRTSDQQITRHPKSSQTAESSQWTSNSLNFVLNQLTLHYHTSIQRCANSQPFQQWPCWGCCS